MRIELSVSAGVGRTTTEHCVVLDDESGGLALVTDAITAMERLLAAAPARKGEEP